MCIEYDDIDDIEDEGIDEDHIMMTCRACGELVFFGDVYHTKNACVYCLPKQEERERREKVERLRSDAEQKVAEFEEAFYAKHPELV